MRTLLPFLSLLACLGLLAFTAPVHAQSVQPELVPGNPTCEDVGYSNLHAFKIDSAPFDGTHDLMVDGEVVGQVTVYNPSAGNPDDHPLQPKKMVNERDKS